MGAGIGRASTRYMGKVRIHALGKLGFRIDCHETDFY